MYVCMYVCVQVTISVCVCRCREYFGEKVAMYFAWFGHFSYFLLVPALLGLIIEVVFAARG